MKKRCRRWGNERGLSTVELLLIMSALVSAALIFKGSLTDFTAHAIEKVFAEPEKAERMTFGGEGL